jgi:hypothetical protein
MNRPVEKFDAVIGRCNSVRGEITVLDIAIMHHLAHVVRIKLPKTWAFSSLTGKDNEKIGDELIQVQ